MLHRIVKDSVSKILKENFPNIDDHNRVFDAYRHLVHVMIWENGNIGGPEEDLDEAENRYLQERGQRDLEILWDSIQEYVFNALAPKKIQ